MVDTHAYKEQLMSRLLGASFKNVQSKIPNLENGIIEHFENVHGKKMICNRHIENMCDTRRKPRQDGFYMFTVQKRNESHGIFIYKETQPNGRVIFHLFDPNGRKWANRGYKLDISYDKPHAYTVQMSPSNIWNDQGGHCAIWCLVVIVLWNSSDDGWSALQLFDQKMSNTRKTFIEGIYNLIAWGKNFDTPSEITDFICQIRQRIDAL